MQRLVPEHAPALLQIQFLDVYLSRSTFSPVARVQALPQPLRRHQQPVPVGELSRGESGKES